MKDDEQYDLNRGVLMFVFMLLVAVWFFAVMCGGCNYERDIQVERRLVKIIEVKEIGFYPISKARIIWQDESGVRYFEFTNWPTNYEKGNISYLLLRK